MENAFEEFLLLNERSELFLFFNRKVPLTTNSSFIVFSEQIAHLCRLHLFFLLSFNQDHFSQWLTHTEIQYYFYFHQNKSTSNFELVFLRYCTIYSGVFSIKIQSKWLFYQRTEWSFYSIVKLTQRRRTVWYNIRFTTKYTSNICGNVEWF